MHIACLLSGLSDPKWPLRAQPASPGAAARIDDASCPRVLSPFDESALELALKMRDAGTLTRLTGLVIAGPGHVDLVRRVGAYRPDALFRIDLAALSIWDPPAWAEELRDVLSQLDGAAPDLVLAGRELGDSDDGSFASFLAERLGRPYFGLAQNVVCAGAAARLVRERGSAEEAIEVAGALLASVTNDRCNRLRHPLLKNVMAAKRASYPVLVPRTGRAASPGEPGATGDGALGRVRLVGAEPVQRPARQAACRLLDGSVGQQAAELARILREWGSAP